MSQFTKPLVLFFCGVFAISQGILAPGPCPLTPPTMFVEDLKLYNFRLLYFHVVPLSKHSYFFKKPDPSVNPAFYSIYSPKATFEYMTVNLTLTTKWSRDGEFLKMKSFIAKDVENRFKGCETTTTDSVKMWYDSNVLVFWSCVQMNKTNSDHALLIAFWEQNHNNKTQNELVRNVTAKFLPDRTLSLIQWDNDKDYTITTCPSPHSSGLPLGYYLFLLSMLVVLVLCFSPTITYKKSNRTQSLQ